MMTESQAQTRMQPPFYKTESKWRPIGWALLALLGQIVALRMIEAGPSIRYQHYRTLPRLISEQPLWLAFMVLQTGVVLWGLTTYGRQIWAWLKQRFKLWQLFGLALVVLLPSAAVSRDVRVYLWELPFAAFVQLLSLGNLLLAVLTLPGSVLARWQARLQRWFGALEPAPDGSVRDARGVDRLALWGALWVTVIAAALSFFSYQRHPHIPDEVVYLYHARYLAEGKLTLPLPPVPEAFDVDLMNYEADRWFCPVPPGWPLALALGVLLGVSWLINPVLAGVNVVLAFLLVRELYDRRTARLAVLLLCISPWHVFMAMNYMTHTFTFTCMLAAALALQWSRRTGRGSWAWLSGIATGAVTLIRPLEGFVFGLLIGLWSIGVGGKRLKFSGLAAFALGGLMMGAAVMPYNKYLTGSPTKFPLMAYADKYYGPNSNSLGFGPDRGWGWQLDPFPGHGLPDALVNSNLNAFSLNIELFGWGTGSLLFIALLLFAGGWRRPDGLMLAIIVAIFTAHIFYWYSGGPDFGARYWYMMLLPCVVLTARGIQWLEQHTRDDGHNASVASGRVLAFVLLASAITVSVYFPWRARDKYYHYLFMRPDVRVLAQQHQFGRSLVLIRGERHPDYASAVIYNPLDWQANAPIYAWDRDPAIRAKVLAAYADRPVWILAGPSVTGAGFQVVAGPTPARELLQQEQGAQASAH